MFKRYFVLVCLLYLSPVLLASDHADPLFSKKMDAGITGFFVFPDGDRMIFILNVHPGLQATAKPPFKLEAYRFRIHVDTDSAIGYKVPADLVRFGGTVVEPLKISEDISFEVELNNDVSVHQWHVKGLTSNEDIKFYSGIRDDPFIFPKFFGTNVIAMVFSVPKSAFPAGPVNWLIWANTSKASNDEQIDHVGRSLRTMNPRLDFLNTIPVNMQAAAVRERHDDPGLIQKILMKQVQPLFGLRHYDIFPDVMIYTDSRPPGFPNGRRLQDDVAALACKGGDCLLWELSFADSNVWPRATSNDKPFLNVFPYLAEPW